MGLLNSKEDDRKPLFRAYVKDLRKGGCPDSEIYDIVERVFLSSNVDWIIIEAENCVALLSWESKAGKTFWEFIQTVEGNLKALKLVPAKGKLGFDIEIDETLMGWYVWDRMAESLVFHDNEPKKTSKGIGNLSLEAMKPQASPLTSVGEAAIAPPQTTDNTPNQNGSSEASRRGRKPANT